MKKFFVLLIVSCSILSAQKKEDGKLSGLLYADSKISFNNSIQSVGLSPDSLVEGKKSPILAGVLSFVVPGAGEFYSESYIKTAVFVAIEAAAITVGLIYNKKGDNQTDFFQNYANQNWSVVRYANWTIANAKTINSSIDPTQYKVFDNSGKVNWNELNRLENDLSGFYSHRLAYFGDQQYYEMIGKYEQFYQGWDDADPTLTSYDEIKAKLNGSSTNFMYYARERGKANDFYDVASKAVVVIVANHFISAIDAAWTASRFNKNLKVSAQLQKFDLGYSTLYYPQLNLQYNF